MRRLMNCIGSRRFRVAIATKCVIIDVVDVVIGICARSSGDRRWRRYITAVVKTTCYWAPLVKLFNTDLLEIERQSIQCKLLIIMKFQSLLTVGEEDEKSTGKCPNWGADSIVHVPPLTFTNGWALGGTVSRRTANEKLNWPNCTDHHESAHRNE